MGMIELQDGIFINTDNILDMILPDEPGINKVTIRYVDGGEVEYTCIADNVIDNLSDKLKGMK